MDHFLLFEPSLVSYLLPASFTGANTVANTSTAGREGLLSLTHLLQAQGTYSVHHSLFVHYLYIICTLFLVEPLIVRLYGNLN